MKKRLLLINNRSDSRQRGNAMTEFVIVIPVLILLIFGTIQIGLIYSAKVTLNYATFQSARLGATNNATYSALRRGLIRGLAPLYTTSSDLDGIKTDIALGINSNAQRRDGTRGVTAGLASSGLPCLSQTQSGPSSPSCQETRRANPLYPPSAGASRGNT